MNKGVSEYSAAQLTSANKYHIFRERMPYLKTCALPLTFYNQIVLALATILLLSLNGGCTAKHRVVVADYAHTDTLYPAISLYRGDREAERAACEQFDQPLLQHCIFGIVSLKILGDAFEKTALFENVRIARETPAYKIYLTQVLYDKEGALELSNAIVSGASLFIAPLNVRAELHVTATLTYMDVEVDTLHYRLPFTQSVGWYDTSNIKEKLALSIVSHIVKDIQKNKLISTDVGAHSDT